MGILSAEIPNHLKLDLLLPRGGHAGIVLTWAIKGIPACHKPLMGLHQKPEGEGKEGLVNICLYS